jgi:hypothetical protein
MDPVPILLAFAAGLSCGFVQGRVFERIDWARRTKVERTRKTAKTSNAKRDA